MRGIFNILAYEIDKNPSADILLKHHYLTITQLKMAQMYLHEDITYHKIDDDLPVKLVHK